MLLVGIFPSIRLYEYSIRNSNVYELQSEKNSNNQSNRIFQYSIQFQFRQKKIVYSLLFEGSNISNNI